MSTYIFILGKDRELSLAELRARYPKAGFGPTGDNFVLVQTDRKIDKKEFDQLGGSIKAGELIKKTDRHNLIQDIVSFLSDHHKSGKLHYGVSVYGWSEKNLRQLLLNLKKEFKKDKINSRFANQRFLNLSAAQHKGLDGIEIMVIKNKVDSRVKPENDSNQYYIAQVVAVQDIDSYSKRDYEKPFRDMKVGMLPPKLAQIMINLAGPAKTIWDPFCGGGVLLMEGLLMGRNVIGSDINEKTLEGAGKNIDWLKREFHIGESSELFVHDATTKVPSKKSDAIVFEGYLGPPQDQLKSEEGIKPLIDELSDLYIRFFNSLKEVKYKGCIVSALPLFRIKGGKELELKKAISKIESMGFKLEDEPLKYARPDQVVGRMIYRFRPS